MQKTIHFVLVAGLCLGAFLAASPFANAAGEGASTAITATLDGSGHRIYVNDALLAPAEHQEAQAPSNGLVFWSSTEKRWKPVPSSNMRAAR